MNQIFNLYNERKRPVVTVSKSNNEYHVKGLEGTQLSYLDRTINDINEFKNNFGLKHAEELSQISMDELL